MRWDSSGHPPSTSIVTRLESAVGHRPCREEADVLPGSLEAEFTNASAAADGKLCMSLGKSNIVSAQYSLYHNCRLAVNQKKKNSAIAANVCQALPTHRFHG